jgi:uncharacterized glyoxalase superfamily protein PhnB
LRSEGMAIINIINEFTVNDIKKAVEFYKSNFNFEIDQTDGNPITWVQMKKENIIIMLEDYKEVCEEIYKFPVKTNTSNLVKFKYDNDKEIKQMYKDLKLKDIEFFMELKQTEYGTIEFGVYDLDKNMIIVSN